MNTVIINLTPHTVTMLRSDNTVQMRYDSDGIARCREVVTQLPALPFDPFGDCGMSDQFPLVTKSFADVDGLPPSHPEKPWLRYIVSQIVMDACADRFDLLVPSDVQRGPDGQVIGCRAFSTRSRPL